MKFNKRLKAIIFMILSSTLFTTMNLFSKLSAGITLYQKAVIANLIAFIIISIVIIKNKISFWGSKNNRKYLLIRGICGSLSLMGLYYTLDHLILSDSTMISKLGPFFATIFGYVILKDKLDKKQLCFLIITIIGALLIIKPSLSFDIFPSLIGLAASACAGIAFTMIRLIGDKEDKFTIIFYNILFSLLISLPFSFSHLKNLSNNKPSIVYMILAGLCISFGQICLTRAYKNAPASSIAMYDYVGLIISAIYGVILFNEIPDLLSIIGYLIIIGISVVNFFITMKTNSTK